MSIFDGGTNTNTESFVDKLVAAKGDNFRDPEAMAKSLLAAQDHIRKVEAENATYREKGIQEDFGKSLLEELRKQTPAGGELTNTVNNTSGAEENTTQLGPEDIKKLVEKAVTERETNRTVEQNIAEADKVMSQKFGDQAGAELSKRASELGLSVQDLKNIAGQSTTAFLKMIGEPAQTQTNQTKQSSVNTASLEQDSGKRNWSYYKNLMKTNEKLYRSRQVQDQMDADLGEQGPSFWNN